MFIFFPCATDYGSRATSEHSKTLAYAVLSRSRVCWMCLLPPHTGNVSASRIGPSPRQPMRSPRSHKGGLNRYSLCRRIEKASGKDSSLVWYTSKVIHMIAWWRPLDASLVSAAVAAVPHWQRGWSGAPRLRESNSWLRNSDFLSA